MEIGSRGFLGVHSVIDSRSRGRCMLLPTLRLPLRQMNRRVMFREPYCSNYASYRVIYLFAVETFDNHQVTNYIIPLKLFIGNVTEGSMELSKIRHQKS